MGELVFEGGLPVHDLVHLFDHQLAEFVDVIDEHVICEILFFFAVDIVASTIGISELFLLMWSDVLLLVPVNAALAPGVPEE